MKNKEFFKKGEANEWFKRNIELLESRGNNKIIDILTDWLKPFEKDISNILEIGCGSGHLLNQMTKQLVAKGFGVDPSSEAVKYINTNFPNLQAKVGFGDSVPYSKKFDLVHLGFFLCYVDRDTYLSCISEADRLVKSGSFLSIIDFDTPYPYSNIYKHLNNVFVYKQNNSDVFVSSGLYSVVNKFQYSHNNFFFNKNINERVSLTLLYKEPEIFKR